MASNRCAVRSCNFIVEFVRNFFGVLFRFLLSFWTFLLLVYYIYRVNGEISRYLSRLMSGSSVWMTVRRRLSMGLLLLVLLLQVLLTAAVRRNDHVFHKIQTSRRLPIVVHRLEDFHHLQKEHSLSDIQVIGNTSAVSASHPTIQLILQRWKTASTPGRRDLNDTKRIALCIEGGGMRGCVSAGAVAAINFLGLNDAVDVVYGSSAGAMIGAYFVSRQYAGLSIYSGNINILYDLFFLMLMYVCV